MNFPNFSSIKRKFNGYDFGAFNYYVEGEPSYLSAMGVSPELHPSFQHGAASYHQWWFGHLPHNPGVRDGKLNNWWPYIFDFNRFDGALIDYRVKGFPENPRDFPAQRGEYGTDAKSAEEWGYWHSQNGFSPGGKAATLSMVSRRENPDEVRIGKFALKVNIENAQYWEEWGVGRNDIFYPRSRNAHWDLPSLREVRFSIKPGDNEGLIASTNPIVRLYKNGGTRIEFVPLDAGVYTNLFHNLALRDEQGWYSFSIPITGSAAWEKHVIGYIDPALPELEQRAERDRLEQEILADLNYVEISIRSITSCSDAPYDVVSFSIDGLQFVAR